MRRRGLFLRRSAVVLWLGLAVSCRSFPKTDIEPGQVSNKRYFFRLAQEAAEKDNYERAHFFYDLLRLYYPNDPHFYMSSRYEDALLYEKELRPDLTRKNLEDLRRQFDDPYFAGLYPVYFKKLLDVKLSSLKKKKTKK